MDSALRCRFRCDDPASNLGWKCETRVYDTGTRPDDSLFTRNNGGTLASFAPNLLLFRHFAFPVRQTTASQLVNIEYDLPIAATVTVEICDSGVGTAISCRSTLQQTFPNQDAGWHAVSFRVNTPSIAPGAVYRITAERGTPSDPETYFIGRYTQFLTFPGGTTATNPSQVNLPLISDRPGAQALPRELVRNGTFDLDAQFAPVGMEAPFFWDVQTIGEGNLQASATFDLVPNFETALRQEFRFKATRRGRVEITQRVRPEVAGCHVLSFILTNSVNSFGTERLVARIRYLSTPTSGVGTPWDEIRQISATGSGTYTETLRVPVGQSEAVLSLLATFAPDSTTSTFRLDQVSLKRADESVCRPAAAGSAAVVPAPISESSVDNAAYPPPAPTRTPRPEVTVPPTLTPSLTPTNSPIPSATTDPYPAPPTATATPVAYPPPATTTLTPTPTTAGGATALFADGFESGSLSAWSASVTDSGDLSVTTNAALVGARGLQALIDGTGTIYVTDNTPASEPSYRAQFRLDPNSLTMGNDEAFDLLNLDTSTTAVARVQLRRSGGSYRLQFLLIDNGGTVRTSTNTVISDAPHTVQLDWRANSTAGATDGSAVLSVDGVASVTMSGAQVGSRRVDRVRFGAPQSLDASTSGILFLDDFQSWRN